MNIPKFVFIIPYRNRENEKIHFNIYMKYLLEDYNLNDYEIYYSHQNDNRLFNRGATKNIGFLAIKDKYPNNYKDITFVFNDIDTMPYKKNVLNYITNKNIIKHFYGFNYALGGIVSITGEDFEKIKGFPNNWGWGLEDNTLQNRALNNNLIIDRSIFYPINDKNILQIKDIPNRILNNIEPKLYKTNKLDNINHINNLKYNILEEDTNSYIINIDNFDTLYNPLKNEIYTKDFTNTNKIPIDKNHRIVSTRWKMY